MEILVLRVTMKNRPRLLPFGVLALFLVTSISASDAAPRSATDFEPLMNSLHRFHGDKTTWSFGNAVLTGKAGGEETRSRRIFTVERFGNFVLRFKARAGSGNGAVLLRSAVHPIEVLAGYKIKLGGENVALSFLDFPDFAKLAEARAKGIPFNNETSLVKWEAASGPADGEWADYELACLGDRLTVKRNGATIVHYRHLGGPPEGSIGFQLDGPGRAQFKDLQLRPLGEVHWPMSPAAGDLKDQPADAWKADRPRFQRLTEEAWTRETKQLLETARDPKGFRPLFPAGAPNQWRESNSFWSVKDGVISGASHNNFLVTEKDYSDFILKTRVRMTPATGNSGIQVRSHISATGMEGYQIDMAVHDTGSVRLPWWGQLYGEELNRGFLFGIDDPGKRLDLVRHEDWNDVVIICKGNHLIVEINGEVTGDLVDYYGDKTGKIGFQIHVGPQMKVEFRDVVIQEL